MYKPAGFWIRLGANVLDGIVLAIPAFVIGLIIKTDTADITINVMQYLYSLLLPVFWNGYTVGKRICGIHIVKTDGTSVTFWTMFMRTVIATLVYALTLGIGLIVSIFMVALREDKRGLHDLVAGTKVEYH